MILLGKEMMRAGLAAGLRQQPRESNSFEKYRGKNKSERNGGFPKWIRLHKDGIHVSSSILTRELSLPICNTALKAKPKLEVVLVPLRPGLVKKNKKTKLHSLIELITLFFP